MRRHLVGIDGARSSWRALNERCGNPRHGSWHRYGGRGISVYPAWAGRGGFEPFLAYMGPRPPGASIDRINGNGNYEPGNVRWADKRTQGRNVTPETRERRSAWGRVMGRRRVHAGALLAFKRYGRVMGFVSTEKLMDEVREALEMAFGPARNMDPPSSPLTVEEAFLVADYSFKSEHYEGLESLTKSAIGHGTWDQLTKKSEAA